MKAAPGTFRGILNTAEEHYQAAVKLLRKLDDDGFQQLITHDEIDSTVVNLSEQLGILHTKRRELMEDGKARPKYQEEIDKIDHVLKEFRKRQKNRNQR